MRRTPRAPGDWLIHFLHRIGEVEARLPGELLRLIAAHRLPLLAAAAAVAALRYAAPPVRRRLAWRGTVGLKLVPPGGVEFDAEAWAAFFRSLRAATPPALKRWLTGAPWITFEYRHSGGLLSTTCWCPAAAEGLVTACLRSAVPGLEVTRHPDQERLPDLRRARGRLAGWRDPVYPLGQPRTDPLASAVEALAIAPVSVLQLVISHHTGWEKYALHRLDPLSGYRPRRSFAMSLPLDLIRELAGILAPAASRSDRPGSGTPPAWRLPSLRAAAPSFDKVLAPGWMTEVRISALSPARGQAKQCVLAVAGAFHALDGETQMRSRRVLLPWLFDRAVARRTPPRSGFLLSAAELAWFFHLPVTGARMDVARVSIAPLPRVTRLPGSVICRADGTGQPVRIAQADRRQHTSILGPTGSGKSALILNLVLQDTEAA